jgi:hypothetical protein
MALLGHAGATLPLEKIAMLCRRAENEYVGAKSGIMDQFVVAGAAAHRAMMIDCRSLRYERLPLPEGVRAVICNSMVKHAVATGEYGDRRDEVEAGQAVLRQLRPDVELLRDATLEDLLAGKDRMSAAKLCAVPSHHHRKWARDGGEGRAPAGGCRAVWRPDGRGACEYAERLCRELSGDRCFGGGCNGAARMFGGAHYRRRLWRLHGELGGYSESGGVRGGGAARVSEEDGDGDRVLYL